MTCSLTYITTSWTRFKQFFFFLSLVYFDVVQYSTDSGSDCEVWTGKWTGSRLRESGILFKAQLDVFWCEFVCAALRVWVFLCDLWEPTYLVRVLFFCAVERQQSVWLWRITEKTWKGKMLLLCFPHVEFSPHFFDFQHRHADVLFRSCKFVHFLQRRDTC